MWQQAFSIQGHKPRIVFSTIEGNITVRTWEKKEIMVEAAEPIQGLRFEADTLFVSHYRSDVTAWVPRIKGLLFNYTNTQVTVERSTGTVSIERTGSVDIRNHTGRGFLDRIEGSVHLFQISDGVESTSIGGSLEAFELPSLRVLGSVGGSTTTRQCGQVALENIGGSLTATGIGDMLSCENIGGSIHIQDSPRAVINTPRAGGSATIEQVGTIRSVHVGGSLTLAGNITNEGPTSFFAGGSITYLLPANPHMTIQAHCGGNIRGSAVAQSRNNAATLIYGEGSSMLTLHAGGSITIHGNQVNR
ncbi:hypothetical protein EI42_02802 [Thermosporothrix hazakensis]|uniref:Adhesin domain-containing protein n=1 Tax=Thermosporothrix hazakensis TaxID=644383 RepID=A0A326U6B1_THEHA|nr:hypothetical protein [Thermosporothrix hazakensis]PZW29506.1 hypothetical protein EI42_02802 [Thermosporothrix hazakensis]GCE45780.1 hypothetical protein KTH_06490 [Thermosporothrix hazakensis]